MALNHVYFYLCIPIGTVCFMDIVFIRGLRVETVIGIYDWEREIRQTLILDMELGTDIRLAAATEEITNTLDYKAVSKRLAAFIEASEFLLVETLAEHCAQLLMDEFGIPWLRLSVNKKGAVSIADDVGVIIERGSRG
jgi:dihydroneopterin aldolase